MSWQALADAARYPAGSAAEKLMLLAYADRHNEETGCAYPSIEWLCEFSSLNRKTVISAIAKLEAAGALTDTGERMGRTKQIKVYRLSLQTVPKTEQYQKRNSTVFSAKQSQKRDTEPSSEPSVAKATSTRAHQSSFPKPEGVDSQVWRDFLANRKAKRLQNTATAHKRLMDDLSRLSDEEWTIPRLLEHAAAKGWGGIYDPRSERQSPHPSTGPPSFLDHMISRQSQASAGG